MYSRPSASVIVAPFADLMKRGVPPTPRNARTGLLTPPGISCLARSNRTEDCGYLLFIGCYSFVAHGRWRPFCDKRLNFGKVLNWARHSVVTRGTGFKRSAQAAARGT